MAHPPTLTTSNKQPAPRCFINATENGKIFSLESLINPNYYFWEGRCGRCYLVFLSKKDMYKLWKFLH